MKILFVHQGLETFVKKDLEILSERFDVRSFRFKRWNNVFALWKEVKWCDITFSWFCSRHALAAALFSKMLGKKSVVITGGYDVADVPEIKYGVYCGNSPVKRIKQMVSRFTLRMVDLVLAVSKSNMDEAKTNGGIDSEKIKVVYHGFDYNKFCPTNTIDKEKVVLTVGNISCDSSPRKGHDLFVKSAAYLPGVQFVLVGNESDDSQRWLKNIASKNVTFRGEISDEALLEIFRRSKVYVQTSRHEAFGCAVAEAMLCECVPVVSRRGALPEVVGDCGFYGDELKPDVVAEKIKEALETGDKIGRRARNRIIENFPREKRKKELIGLLETLMAES